MSLTKNQKIKRCLNIESAKCNNNSIFLSNFPILCTQIISFTNKLQHRTTRRYKQKRTKILRHESSKSSENAAAYRSPYSLEWIKQNSAMNSKLSSSKQLSNPSIYFIKFFILTPWYWKCSYTLSQINVFCSLYFLLFYFKSFEIDSFKNFFLSCNCVWRYARCINAC